MEVNLRPVGFLAGKLPFIVISLVSFVARAATCHLTGNRVPVPIGKMVACFALGIIGALLGLLVFVRLAMVSP